MYAALIELTIDQDRAQRPRLRSLAKSCPESPAHRDSLLGTGSIQLIARVLVLSCSIPRKKRLRQPLPQRPGRHLELRSRA